MLCKIARKTAARMCSRFEHVSLFMAVSNGVNCNKHHVSGHKTRTPLIMQFGLAELQSLLYFILPFLYRLRATCLRAHHRVAKLLLSELTIV